MNDFSVDSKVLDDVVVLYPSGYLNNILGEGLESRCGQFLDRGIRKIVLNFRDIEFINSIGISIVLGIMDLMENYDGLLCFTNLASLHNETFEMLGLKGQMRVFEDEEQAVLHLKGKGGPAGT